MLIILSGQERIRDIFMILFNMKVFCVYSLESPLRGDSYKYKHYTVFNIKKIKSPLIIPNLQNEFESAVVNEPSVFEPLKVY